MLTTSRKSKLLQALKDYGKRYLNKYVELDESGTRLMINTFLTDVLGFAAIDEVKTEYMIRGTYADYMIQINDKRHFLVEVKALSIGLSENHLRQAVNYGANEGIEWALLTNGRQFELYKILFEKPIDSKLVFAFDLSEPAQLKESIEYIQYLHRDAVTDKGLEQLWNKSTALDPCNVAGLLYDPTVVRFLRLALSKKYGTKFSEEEIIEAVDNVICDPIELETVKTHRAVRLRKPKTIVDLGNVQVVAIEPKVETSKPETTP